MKTNQQRLISHWDTYEFLRNIPSHFEMETIDYTPSKFQMNFLKELSPLSRTCESANLWDPPFCVCSKVEIMEIDDQAYSYLETILEKMNNQTGNGHSVCEKFLLDRYQITKRKKMKNQESLSFEPKDTFVTGRKNRYTAIHNNGTVVNLMRKVHQGTKSAEARLVPYIIREDSYAYEPCKVPAELNNRLCHCKDQSRTLGENYDYIQHEDHSKWEQIFHMPNKNEKI